MIHFQTINRQITIVSTKYINFKYYYYDLYLFSYFFSLASYLIILIQQAE